MYHLISLFSGAGGLDYGFEKTKQFKTLLSVESQPFFCETLKLNKKSGFMKNTTLLESDIREIDPLKAWKNVSINNTPPDGIIGGPPCESFSVRGNRLGVKDSRGMLIFEFMKWVTELKPNFFLMENVKQLATQDNGEILDSILTISKENGFNVTHSILKSSDFGAPTIRERLFVVGVKKGKYVFPPPTHGDAKTGLPPVKTVGEALGDLPEADQNHPGTPQGHVKIRHTPVVVERFKKLAPGKQCPIRKRVRLRFDKPSQTLYAGNLQGTRWHIHPSEPREITNREAARIHGFPDNFEFNGGHAAMAKQIANSVPIPVAESLAKSFSSLLAHDCPEAKYSIKKYIGQRSPRGSLNPEKLLSKAGKIISEIQTAKRIIWTSMTDLKAFYSPVCKSYYQLAAVSRGKHLETSLRKEILDILFQFRSSIETKILLDLQESETKFDVEKEVLRGRFFGASAKQGLSIRYSLNSCYPTKDCSGRCYAHDGRDRELNHLIRGVLNYYYGLKYEGAPCDDREIMMKKLSSSISKAIKQSIEEQHRSKQNGFSRLPRIRFSHIGEMARTPVFTNDLAREIRSQNPKVQCVIYTRSPEANLLDKDLFIINFTIDDSSDSRLKYACKWMNVVNSAWDGKLTPKANVNFLEHHVEKVSLPHLEGSICPVTYDHKSLSSCDQAMCDKCFKVLS